MENIEIRTNKHGMFIAIQENKHSPWCFTEKTAVSNMNFYKNSTDFEINKIKEDSNFLKLSFLSDYSDLKMDDTKAICQEYSLKMVVFKLSSSFFAAFTDWKSPICSSPIEAKRSCHKHFDIFDLNEQFFSEMFYYDIFEVIDFSVNPLDILDTLLYNRLFILKHQKTGLYKAIQLSSFDGWVTSSWNYSKNYSKKTSSSFSIDEKVILKNISESDLVYLGPTDFIGTDKFRRKRRKNRTSNTSSSYSDATAIASDSVAALAAGTIL